MTNTKHIPEKKECRCAGHKPCMNHDSVCNCSQHPQEDVLPKPTDRKRIDPERFVERAKFLKKNYQEEQEYLAKAQQPEQTRESWEDRIHHLNFCKVPEKCTCYANYWNDILQQLLSSYQARMREKIEGSKINKGQLGSPNPKLFSEVIQWPFWMDSFKKENNEMWQTAVAARIAVERNQTVDDILAFFKQEE